MHRNWFIALPLAAALVLGACGGGGDDDGDGANGGDATAEASAAPSPTQIGDNDANGQPTANTGIPTPTPVAEEDVVITVVNGGTVYTPTLADFRALPQTQIDAAGASKSGVSVATLAAQVGAESGVVLLQGLNPEQNKVASIRYTIEEIAANTVLVIDETGHLDLVSSTLPETQWLRVVIAVSFGS